MKVVLVGCGGVGGSLATVVVRGAAVEHGAGEHR